VRFAAAARVQADGARLFASLSLLRSGIDVRPIDHGGRNPWGPMNRNTFSATNTIFGNTFSATNTIFGNTFSQSNRIETPLTRGRQYWTAQ
jgi:hypothetical protein